MTTKFSPGEQVFIKVTIQDVTVRKVKRDGKEGLTLIDLDKGELETTYTCIVYNAFNEAVASLHFKEEELRPV